MSEPKETKPASPAIAKSTPLNVPPSRQSTLPRAGSVESPVIQYATAVAANLPVESPRMAPPSASPSVSAATVIKESPSLASATTNVVMQSPQVTPAAAVVAESSPAPEPAQTPSQPSPAAKPATTTVVTPTAPAEEPSDTVPEPTAAQSSNVQPPVQAAEETVQQKEETSSPRAQSQTPASTEPAIRLPAALADLAHSFETSKDRAMAKEVGFFVHQMLEASYQFIPEATDTER